MPIYEYFCRNCDAQFERIQKISDAPIKECPHCHKACAEKMVSAAGFQLKGSGWYETDFKSKAPSASASDSTGNKTESSAKSNEASPKKATGKAEGAH